MFGLIFCTLYICIAVLIACFAAYGAVQRMRKVWPIIIMPVLIVVVTAVYALVTLFSTSAYSGLAHDSFRVLSLETFYVSTVFIAVFGADRVYSCLFLDDKKKKYFLARVLTNVIFMAWLFMTMAYTFVRAIAESLMRQMHNTVVTLNGTCVFESGHVIGQSMIYPVVFCVGLMALTMNHLLIRPRVMNSIIRQDDETEQPEQK